MLLLLAFLMAGCSARPVTNPSPAPSGVPSQALLPTPTPACVPAAQAASAAGRVVTVCGVLVEVTYRPGTAGRPTFLNFERPYPNPVFVAVVWGENRAKFKPAPEQAFQAGSRLCVTGRVDLYRGTAQVEVTDPNQIQPC